MLNIVSLVGRVRTSDELSEEDDVYYISRVDLRERVVWRLAQEGIYSSLTGVLCSRFSLVTVR